MKELIPVAKNSINETEVLTCDARALHTFMGVKTPFKDWVRRRIEKYGFTEGQDYIKIVNDTTLLKNERLSPNDFQAPIDYTLSIDMAKQLAMVENNDKGMEVRRYFINCERIAKESVSGKTARPRRSSSEINARSVAISLRALSRMKVYPEEMRAIFAARAVTALTGESIQPLLPPIRDSRDGWLTATAIGERLNISANAVGRLLKSYGLHGSFDTDHKHSQPVWDKSPYSNKEVVSYLYNPAIVVPRIKEALTGDKVVQLA